MDSTNLFDNRYKLIKKLGQGAYGTVYSATDTRTDNTVALKIARRSLASEAKVYELLHRHRSAKGIPRLLRYAKNGEEYIAMNKLGNSIRHYLRNCGNRFSLKTVAKLGIQMISLLETVHNAGIVHGDVKDNNFVMDEQCQALYIIDFGLSLCYINPKTKTHVAQQRVKGVHGTLAYASINTHKKILVSRRDDMESVAYVLIRLLKGCLPWSGMPAYENKQKTVCRIGRKKINTGVDVLCEGVPEHIKQMVVYVRELRFAERPDYAYIQGLLRSALDEQGLDNDGVYDWMVNHPSS